MDLVLGFDKGALLLIVCVLLCIVYDTFCLFLCGTGYGFCITLALFYTVDHTLCIELGLTHIIYDESGYTCSK